jgi:hypothetical protein
MRPTKRFLSLSGIRRLGLSIYPVATSSILPHLKAYLPHASTELYVVPVEISPAPNSTVLATFPPTKSPPESSASTVGVLAAWNHRHA